MSSAENLWEAAKGLTLDKPSTINPVDDDKLAGFTLFKDFEEKPAMAVRIEFARDIMREGRTTITTLLTSIAIFGLLFGIGLLLIIERSVVSRILRLSGRVDEIGKSDNSADRVTVVGQDEITSLSRSINSMLGSLAEKSRAIQTIMDNVDFGLLRCDRSGKILSGYSKSCGGLLGGGSAGKLDGQTIWGALGLSARDSENFQNLFEQAAGDSLLAEDLVRQLPSRFTQPDKTLSLFGSVIVDAKGDVKSVLFTVANITALAKAERENELNQSLLKILNSKDRFGELALRVLADADGKGSLAKLLQSGAKPEEAITQAKRSLHTWKGDFSVFNMREIAEEIHEIEENASNMSVIQSGISAIGKSLKRFLESHGDLLGLNPKELDVKQYQISAQSLKGLSDQIHKAGSLADAQKAVDSFARETSYEEAHRFLGHLTGSAVELGKRMGKDVRVEIQGGKTKLPAEYSPVYNSLVHLFRNAVDHGLERPGDRGGKSSQGTIRVDCKLVNSKYQIEISDDGRGIDLEAVRARAEKKGIIKPGDWANMSEQQKILLVFHSGFTTREDVTQTSGRGIGLDVVADAVKAAKGDIKVTSAKGNGTIFVITLPEIA
jgi:two-component system chemotaxis sensor kinase CheA